MLTIHLCNWQKFFKILLDKTLKYAKFLLVFIYTLYIRKVYRMSQPEVTTPDNDPYEDLLSVVDEGEFSDDSSNSSEDDNNIWSMKMAYADFLIRSNTNRYVI